MLPSFDTSKEGKFLADLIPAYENRETDTFTDIVYEYDQMYKLDKLKSTLLLAAKQALITDEEPNLA